MTTSPSAGIPGQVGDRRTGSHGSGGVASTSLIGGPQRTTAWAGYLIFAASMLILIGFFDMIAGLVAIFKDGYYVVPSRDLVVSVDYTAWGWVHLALGVAAVATGTGIVLGKMWARVVGVGYAIVNAIVNLAFLSAYPVWSAMIIAFDVLVIWALCVHGRELE